MHRKWLWFLLLVCSLPSFEGRALPTDWSERIAHAQMLATTSDPTDQVIKTCYSAPGNKSSTEVHAINWKWIYSHCNGL